LHDSIALEERGIPTVAVVTSAFRIAARAQAAKLGRPDYDAVYVEHPIQDQTKDEIRRRADVGVEEVVARLLGR
jgi:hypothetical protein